MRNSIALMIVLVSTIVFAGKKHEHRHHEAHVHGGATLNIAFDQLNGKVEFKAASEGVLGFEHEAKSENEKKKLSETLAKFENSIGSMIKFEESLGCTFAKDKIGMVSEEEGQKATEKGHDKHKGEHSDFAANYTVVCKTEIKGSKLTIDFSQFKGVNDLDVTLLVGDLQKSVEVKRKPVTVELK